MIGCDFRTRQQTLAMPDAETGEGIKTTLAHEGNNVPEFYCTLPRVRAGIDANGSMRVNQDWKGSSYLTAPL
jgi:hypothetical protein